MAIERMKKLTILFPVREGERFEEWLYAKRALHLVSVGREFLKLAVSGNPLAIDEQEAAQKLAHVKELLSEATAFHKPRKSFIDGMLPVKTIVAEDEMEKTLEAVDLATLYAPVRDASHGIKDCRGDLNRLSLDLETARIFSFFTRPIQSLMQLTQTFMLVAEASRTELDHIAKDEEARKILAWEVKGYEGNALKILFAGLKRDEARCKDIVAAHGFRLVELPDFRETPAERMETIRREMGMARERLLRHERKIGEMLPIGIIRPLECLKGYWESEKKRAEQSRAMLCSKLVGVARGYSRAADTPNLIRDMESKFKGVSVIAADPEPGDNVPVSIKLSRWWRPGQLMVTMYGLPDYFTLDPTPFLTLVFLAFFGICFADVIYGALLIFFSWLLIRRYRQQENLREFFRLFLYAGVSTVIFGVLTGSWAADIYNPEYLGQNNLLLRFVQKTTVLDMLAKPVIALLVALIIGILVQFYGIVMRIIKDLKQHNWQGALYDGVLWLVYLGGLLIFAISSLSGFGGAIVKHLSLGMVLSGMVGLILTQGRDQKGWTARLITGFVSLYGILGGYGTTSFVGDVLSYSRLLALGLNTYIVGMSFNIIAKLIPQILTSVFPWMTPIISFPLVGGTIVITIMCAGHLFNFTMSILSAFVHSARLILLEFFGRFYQGGGGWFDPHGFSSESVEMLAGSKD
ncbi:MAG: hypothetical protein NT045_04085 [Candidatus Aureabacteria bacterium]|nr:hypothetical protein [Candidatus Auribacterota bacterium]